MAQLKNLQIKVPAAFYDEFNEAFEASGKVSKAEFLALLMEDSQASNHDLEETIKARNERIDELNLQVEERERGMNTFKEAYEKLKSENEELENRCDDLAQRVIPAGAILLHPDPFIDALLSRYVSHLNKKVSNGNKQASKEDILVSLFYRVVQNGPKEYLPLVFSTSQLKELYDQTMKNDVKAEEREEKPTE
ncbi:MAG: hypothetical protein RBR21_03255 [Bacteroidales bacterium]|nr:hypothetical protein [Bacteroidales bacterium]